MPAHTRSQVENNISLSSGVATIIVLMAFALLVSSVWRFVPERAQFIILLGVPLIGCLAIWGRYARLWLRRHADHVWLRLDVPCQLNSWWGTSLYLIIGVVLLLSYFRDANNDGVIRLAWGFGFLTLAITAGLENRGPIVVTDNGFCCRTHMILPWRVIKEYAWDAGGDGDTKLRVLYKKSWLYRGTMTIQVPVVYREALTNLLAQKVTG